MAKFKQGEHVFAGPDVRNQSGWGHTPPGTPGRVLKVRHAGWTSETSYDVKFDNGEVVEEILEQQLRG